MWFHVIKLLKWYKMLKYWIRLLRRKSIHLKLRTHFETFHHLRTKHLISLVSICIKTFRVYAYPWSWVHYFGQTNVKGKSQGLASYFLPCRILRFKNVKPKTRGLCSTTHNNTTKWALGHVVAWGCLSSLWVVVNCNIETVVAICELNELDNKSWGEMTFPFHLLYSILLEGSVIVVWCPLSLCFLFHQGESSEGFFEWCIVTMPHNMSKWKGAMVDTYIFMVYTQTHLFRWWECSK